MNKPDWKDAPEWANWLAKGASNTWVWCEYAPILIQCHGDDTCAAYEHPGRTKLASPQVPYRERRPHPEWGDAEIEHHAIGDGGTITIPHGVPSAVSVEKTVKGELYTIVSFPVTTP